MVHGFLQGDAKMAFEKKNKEPVKEEPKKPAAAETSVPDTETVRGEKGKVLVTKEPGGSFSVFYDVEGRTRGKGGTFKTYEEAKKAALKAV